MNRAKQILRCATIASVLAISLPVIASAANYEAVYLPGSPQLPFELFRVTVATGQVSYGIGAPATFTTIPETAPLPPGDYHLYLADQPATAAGAITWAIARMDSKSGRTWTLVGGGPTPFSWSEIAAPH